jgi:hydroxypyruvate reductase
MTDLKQIALRIFHETLAAIDISETMRRKLAVRGKTLCCGDAEFDLGAFRRVCVVALGKASEVMAEGLLSILPDGLPMTGIVVAPERAISGVSTKRREGWQYLVSSHPVPDETSWAAGRAILQSLELCDAETLVFFLLSGGGSALAELPLHPGQSLQEVQQVNRALVTCGAPIDAINTVRKHLSAVKGGRLAVAAGTATKITLAVSDVPAGKESALASGPTIADPTTLGDFERLVRDYALEEHLPATIKEWFASGNMPETPKAEHPAFANAHFFLMLGMDDLFHPAHHAAEAQGCIACCDNTSDDWPVEKAAEYLLRQLAELREIHPDRRVALIADGEVSSPVTGNGVGGRNSAFVLSCVPKIAGQRIAVLSAGTDGIDGNSPAAGAVADGDSFARGESAKLDAGDYFRRSDAYSYFAALHDAMVTGPTGNNLRDLRILIAEPTR